VSRNPPDEAEAVALQLELRQQVVSDIGLVGEPRLVAGVDVAYDEGSDRIAGAVAVLDLSDLSLVEVATAAGVAEFPYVPGLLAFREIPILLQALSQLRHLPQVLVCDGYGIAHPRRFGLASHLGVVTGVPAFGVGKTPFIGEFGTVGNERGSWADLFYEGDIVGRAVRTQKGVKPVFVSPGHLIDLGWSTDLTLRLAPKYRLPETTRMADRASREALKALL
jgi:deoxyribonuclease V